MVDFLYHRLKQFCLIFKVIYRKMQKNKIFPLLYFYEYFNLDAAANAANKLYKKIKGFIF